MKKLILSWSFIIAFFIGFAQEIALNVHIDGWNNDTVFVRGMYLNDLSEFEKIVVPEDGKFALKFKSPVELFAISQQSLYFDKYGGIYAPFSKLFRLILSGENVSVEGNLTQSHLDFTSKGSEFCRDYTNYRKTVLTDIIMADSLYIAANELDQKNDSALIKKLFAEYYKYRNNIYNKRLKYVEDNQNELSSYFLMKLGYDDFERYYSILREDFKNGILKPTYDFKIAEIKEYKEVLANKERMKSGNQVPDFRLESPQGFNFGLNYCDKTGTIIDTGEGKVAETVELILLDFWGTWCGPCIAEMPRIKEIKEKYPKRLRIISIACNESSKEKWAEYVKDNHDLMADNWFHVIDEKNEVWKKYGVEAFPTFVLVDNRTDKELIGTFNSREIYKKVEEILGE
jgi:thiol-disulfide isomerase/thioredoxin